MKINREPVFLVRFFFVVHYAKGGNESCNYCVRNCYGIYGWLQSEKLDFDSRHENEFISSIRPSTSRSHWPRGLRRRSSAARLLRFWVRIPPGAWMFVCCECCVLSGRGLCDGLITRPEESYRLWHVVVCDQETSKTRRLKPAIGL